MRVAIAYPPLDSPKGVPLLTQNRQFQWFSSPTYIFPVVPASAATMLKCDGHDILFLDGIAAELDSAAFMHRLAEFCPDVIVLETKTPVVKRHWRWIAENRIPGCRYILVGDHVTALPEESFANSPVDLVLTGGDWDFLLRSVISCGFDPVRFEPGIWYRDASGQVKSTGPFRLDHDLNSAPRIDRDLVHWELYARKNGNFKKAPGTYVMAGRDCWHAKCTFCSWTTLYPKYRIRSVKNVVDEIEELVTRYGVKEIMDDSGTFPCGQWLKDFCAEMVARGLNKKVRIDCNMRFGRLGADDYKMMRRAGFRLVLFGVESANQETLDRFNKALKVEDVENGAKWATEAGLSVHLTFMFGHAWEGPAEIANTVRLARRLLANGHAATLQCTLTIPYPGTPLFRELKENNGLATLDWDAYDQRTAITKTPRASEEDIKKAIRDVYRGFLQPRALWHLLRRNLFDLSFYWRGLKRLRGHLSDFGSCPKASKACAAALAFFASFCAYAKLPEPVALSSLPSECRAIPTVKAHAPSLLPRDRRFTLVWNDEFDGNALDDSKWSYRTNFWGRRAHWFAAPEDGAVEVTNGLCRLKLLKKPDGQFVSPQLQTGEIVWDVPSVESPKSFWPLPGRDRPKFMHRYGFYECRCRLQRKPGWWSAFWMQTPSQGCTLDPAFSGIEHDIMESFDPGRVIVASFHTNGYGPDYLGFHIPSEYDEEPRFEGKLDLAVDTGHFHHFGLLWEPDGYSVYVDGRLRGRSAVAVSRIPEFLLISTEAKWYRKNRMTGEGVPELEEAAAAGDDFTIDFVRVYDIIQ